MMAWVAVTMTIFFIGSPTSVGGVGVPEVSEIPFLGDALQEPQEVGTPQAIQSSLCDTSSASEIKAIHEFDVAANKGSTKFRVGVNAIRGFEAAIKEYSLVFEDYLTKTAGKKFDPPLEFEMIPMGFEDLLRGDMDFFLANPGVFSCLGVERDASALATVIARLDVRGRVHDLDVFAGRFI